MEQNVILPTIGRRLWFWPQHQANIGILDPKQPCDAGVVFVYDERTVNLDVTDHLGRHSAQLSVRLVQPGDPVPDGPHATWMDYQVRNVQMQSCSVLPPQEPIAVTTSGTLIEPPLTNDDQRQESTELQSTGDGTIAADDESASPKD